MFSLRKTSSALLKKNYAAVSRIAVANQQQAIRAFSVVTPKPINVPNAIEFKTMVEMFEKSVVVNASNNVFGTFSNEKGDYEWMTYAELGREVEKFRNVLAHHNFGANDKVSVISNNRVEWVVIALAAASRGGHIVPMYEAQLEDDWKHIISDSDSKLIVAATEKIYNKVKNYVGTVGVVESAMCMDCDESHEHSYKHWMKKVENEEPVAIINPSPDDLMTIIYTSGTTGKPKGVELTHANLVANLNGLADIWGEENYSAVSLAFLPWAHVFGQTCELYTLMATGSAIAIAPNREAILTSLPLVKPTLMFSVPTLFNKVYDGFHTKIADESPLKQKLVAAALANSRERNHALEFGKDVSFMTNFMHGIYDKVIFSKVRASFGGRLKYMCSGGAANNLKVLQFFEDIGIPICEGYGLTETSPVLSTSKNNWIQRRLGCAGIIVGNITVKILDPETMEEVSSDKEGEVCATGPSIMKGYRKNQAANDEVFHMHSDGQKYFRTGDLGMMVEGKFLKITGRIKEQFKLENGKYVVPAPLEDYVSRSRYVAQTFLYGDNKPYNVVFIVPEVLEVRKWAAKNGLEFADDQAMMQSDEVRGLMSKEILENSTAMKGYERPKKWDYTLEPFSQENYLLTPKMSIRRNNVMKLYGEQILACFADGGINMRSDIGGGKMNL